MPLVPLAQRNLPIFVATAIAVGAVAHIDDRRPSQERVPVVWLDEAHGAAGLARINAAAPRERCAKSKVATMELLRENVD